MNCYSFVLTCINYFVYVFIVYMFNITRINNTNYETLTLCEDMFLRVYTTLITILIDMYTIVGNPTMLNSLYFH